MKYNNENRIKSLYLLKILPKYNRNEILFKLSLNEEKYVKQLKYKINKQTQLNMIKNILNELKVYINQQKKHKKQNYLILIIYVIVTTLILFFGVISDYNNQLQNLSMILFNGVGHLILLFYIIWYLSFQSINIKKELSLKKVTFNEIFFMLISVIIISFTLILINIYNTNLTANNSFGIAVFSFLLYPTIVPLTEEILFRRIIYRFLRNNVDIVTAVSVTSILFVAVHNVFNLQIVLTMFACSVLLTILYEINGNLILPVLTHSLSNLAAVLFKYYTA